MQGHCWHCLRCSGSVFDRGGIFPDLKFVYLRGKLIVANLTSTILQEFTPPRREALSEWRIKQYSMMPWIMLDNVCFHIDKVPSPKPSQIFE